MLLATHTDSHHISRYCFGLAEPLPNRAGGSFAPGVRMLLFGARGQIRNQIVSLGRGSQDFPIARVDDQDLRGLSPAIDAN